MRLSDLDRRAVRHRRFTSSFRLVSPERKALTRSCTPALSMRTRGWHSQRVQVSGQCADRADQGD